MSEAGAPIDTADLCPICLEGLNGNIQSFCCGTYHKKCLLLLLKNTKKCSICHFKYDLYADLITDEDNNLHQIIYKSMEEMNEKFYFQRDINMDLIARITHLENTIKSLNHNNTSTRIINENSMRLGKLEYLINDLKK